MNVSSSVLDLVGGTPLVRLKTGFSDTGPQTLVKLEFYNPTGSVKDRMVSHIISEAVTEGRLKAGDTVIDNTSGNTGCSIGMVASLYGLHSIVVAPEKTSREKIDLIKSYGSKVIITRTEAAHDDPEGCYLVARRLARENNYFDLDQYDSQKNVEAHFNSTGPEIWDDTDGQITHFVAGIGTGGTFSGTAKFLKEKNPAIKAIAVDPDGSIFADYIRNGNLVESRTYQIEGIGSDVITKAMYCDLVDEVITISDQAAFERARLICKNEGISAGGSSGAVAVAMEQVAGGLDRTAVIVGIFADAGIRYLSKCYNDDWMRQQGYLKAPAKE